MNYFQNCTKIPGDDVQELLTIFSLIYFMLSNSFIFKYSCIIILLLANKNLDCTNDTKLKAVCLCATIQQQSCCICFSFLLHNQIKN